jgi:hypothetical protein
MLGNVSYTAAQLGQILNQPVGTNGLISLAHQLIAAKLNIANGADGSSIAPTIANADALIGNLVVPPIGTGYLSPSTVAADVVALTNFNEGITGPGSCEVQVRGGTSEVFELTENPPAPDASVLGQPQLGVVTGSVPSVTYSAGNTSGGDSFPYRDDNGNQAAAKVRIP